MGLVDMGCDVENPIEDYEQGIPLNKLLDYASLTPVESGKTQGWIAGDILDYDVGNAEDMCLDSLEAHIQSQVYQSIQLVGCTMVEEHVVAHLQESVEALLWLTGVILAELSLIVLS